MEGGMAKSRPTPSETSEHINEQCAGAEELKKYRDHLVLAEQKAQEDFDKTVLSLSGGALGISFAFVTDVAGDPPFKWPLLLLGAWACWGSSVFSVLVSYFASHLALRRAIRQVDTGEIYNERVGGIYDLATAVLNGLGAVLFVAGVILITCFAYANLEMP
jgi:hypothetical protein